MKRLLTIKFLIICTFLGYGQPTQFTGTWITEYGELLLIEEMCPSFCFLEGTKVEYVTFFKLLGDTMSFQTPYVRSWSGGREEGVFQYDLKIIDFDDRNLVVRPISRDSRVLFNYKEKLTFTKQEYAVDHDIEFEKLIFHVPIYSLEIDSTRKVKLTVKEVDLHSNKNKDKSKYGNFVGTLDKTRYNQLIHLIQTCQLETLEFDGSNCCDGTIRTIIVYFNGQRKILSSIRTDLNTAVHLP
jgi:hypothetical protein